MTKETRRTYDKAALRSYAELVLHYLLFHSRRTVHRTIPPLWVQVVLYAFAAVCLAVVLFD